MIAVLLFILVSFNSPLPGLSRSPHELDAMNIPLYKKDTPYCMRPLLSVKDITEDNIAVSSSRKMYGSKNRVRTAGAPWCPERSDQLGEWVQVDLGSLKMVAGLIVEGWKWEATVADFDKEWTDYITHYSVEYSADGREWMEIKDENDLPRHFHVEREHKKLRQYYYKPRARFQSFDPLIHARMVRLNIHAWHRVPCLSMEVLGCDSHWALTNTQLFQKQPSMKIADCHYIQRIEIRDWQITPKSARFFTAVGRATWCADRIGSRDLLELDLMRRQFISRMIVKKRPADKESDTTILDTGLVKLSEDGHTWTGLHMDKTGWNNEKYASAPQAARYVRVETKNLDAVQRCLTVEIFGCSDEVQSLGLWNEEGRLKIDWVTLSEKTNERHKVRLVKPGSDIWCAKKVHPPFIDFAHRNVKEKPTNWLQVDMKKTFAITRIFTMAQTKGNSLECTKYQTYKYVLLYSVDGEIWSLHRHYNHESGELRTRVMHVHYKSENHCGAYADIVPTIYTRYLKLIMMHGKDCISLELFGNEAGKPLQSQGKRKPGCDAPLGMQSRRIRNSQITASSFSTANTRVHNARLNSNGVWCVGAMKHVGKYYGVNDSLVVDLLLEKYIDGFATQGHYDRSINRWVTGYLVHYSIDGLSWDIISTGETERYFPANKDTTGTVRHYLNPRIRARYLKFLPVTWHKWICMRLEIYGCEAEESLQEKLDKDLREIEKERVDYVAVETGEDPPHWQRKREDVLNIFFKKRVVDCVIRENEPWGNFHLLKHALDFDQTKWEQTAFNKSFNASGTHKLFLTSFRVDPTKSAKHYTCTGKLHDGTELFKHHVIAAKAGPKTQSKNILDYATSLDVPQILVLQRVDPAYDGGKPIWTKPATVWASGSVASIGIFVYGIPFFPAQQPMKVLPKKMWNNDYLGSIRFFSDCARLALAKGYDYYMWFGPQTKCYGSWYSPNGLTIDEEMTHHYPGAFAYIKGIKKWEKYQIKWSKRDQTTNQWIPLFDYHVTDPDRASPSLFTMKPEHDENFDNYARFKGKFRAYDKAYYGDGFTGSHVLDIEGVTADDLGTYKVEVYVPGRKVRNEAIIELRHRDEPRISLPVTFGACLKTPTEMNVTMNDENSRDPNPWNIDWYHVKVRGTKRHRLLQLPRNSVTLKVANPLLEQTGQMYEVDVKNKYGLARAVAKILVTKEVPRITWVTPSPHLAAQDLSDVLEVKTENDKTLVTVDWYHNGTLIQRDTEGFAFPGEKYDSSSFRKKLKLARISMETAGTYRVVAKGEYCQYEEKIEVKVIIRPRLVIQPHAYSTRVVVGHSETTMNVTVKGGSPKPQVEDMAWKKGGKLLTPARRGRVILYTTLTKAEDWLSVLIIKDLKTSDTGDYTFTVKSGPAESTVTRSLLVLSRLPNFGRGDTENSENATISDEDTRTTPSSRASLSHSMFTMLFYLPCISLGLTCYCCQ